MSEIDIVNRLRFDAIRCEAAFSKGVAGNITEAADEIERLRAALARSMTAIDDWLHTYAAELCDPERFEEASRRIGEYGTLSYIAHVQEQNRAALNGVVGSAGGDK